MQNVDKMVSLYHHKLINHGTSKQTFARKISQNLRPNMWFLPQPWAVQLIYKIWVKTVLEFNTLAR